MILNYSRLRKWTPCPLFSPFITLFRRSIFCKGVLRRGKYGIGTRRVPIHGPSPTVGASNAYSSAERNDRLEILWYKILYLALCVIAN